MRRWMVAGGLLEQTDGLLLVCNRRRGGQMDWSPPGGVIDAGESVLQGLTREVAEETGLRVSRWTGPSYEIEVDFVDLDMHLRVESYLAVEWSGELVVDDPDGIVVDAGFSDVARRSELLEASPLWVREPLLHWVEQRPAAPMRFRYAAVGLSEHDLSVRRL